jgi:hypothetical protein
MCKPIVSGLSTHDLLLMRNMFSQNSHGQHTTSTQTVIWKTMYSQIFPCCYLY